MAARLRALPEFRGRDRLQGAILSGAIPPAEPVRCVIGPDLQFDARLGEDGSWRDLYFLQYEPPALTPVLETFVTEGSTFVDIGANIGIYTAWAARLTGSSGRVLAFEPIPATREHLAGVIDLNRLGNVRVIPKALGAAAGTVTLWVVPGASGLTSALAPSEGTPARRIDVPMTTLDDELAASGGQPPTLIKIDVEGYEMSVLQGAARTLAGPRAPAVVFETDARHLAKAGVTFSELIGWFEDRFGYRLYAMLPAGLAPISRAVTSPPASNTLALHPQRHRAAFEQLRRQRFRRNQSC